MILVDTSVWIEYFRGGDEQLTLQLKALLDDDRVALAIPIKLEILGGSSAKSLPALRRVLEAFPLFFPSDSTWERMEAWIEKAVSKGERFGAADLLIAALAAERQMPLWSLDGDFARMQQLGFIRLYTPSSPL